MRPTWPAVPVPVAQGLFRLRLVDLWQALRSQPASFWCLLSYLFVEYVRAQQAYPVLDVLPWGKITLLLTLLMALAEGVSFRPRSIATPLLLTFFGVVIASSIGAMNPNVAFDELPVMFSWVLVYFLITSIVTTQVRFLLFTGVFLLFHLKMAQHGVRSWAADGFRFRNWGATGAPGWFSNSGEFGIAMVIFLALSAAFVLSLSWHWSRWKQLAGLMLPVLGFVCTLASSSRGAMLGAAFAALFLALRTQYKFRAIGGLVVLGLLAFLLLPAEQISRFRSAGDDETSRTRITYWKDGIEITKDHPILGVGYKNWLPFYHRHYNPRGQVPHNIFIECSAELGLLGLAAFMALIVATFIINSDTRTLAKGIPPSRRFLVGMSLGLDCSLVGYLVAGFFVTVLYYPFFWINLAMSVALHNAARDGVNQAGTVLAGTRTGTLPAYRRMR